MSYNHNPGLEAANNWKADYAALRLSYDRSALDAALLAFLRTEMAADTVGADADTLYVMLCTAFVKLSSRGAVEPIRPLSSEGERQLAELRSSFNVVSGDRPVDPELTVYDRVLEAFNGNKTPMSEIKKMRKDPQFEAAYIKALENGDIK
jgi:predicted exporter